MVVATPEVVARLRQQLLDPAVPIEQRFRTLFSLRNCTGNAAREALEAGMDDPSALLAHEAAFCLGQMQDEKAVPALEKCLKNSNIHPMVRHEAAEALGAIGSLECLSLLEQRAHDAAPEVAETCQLALRRIAHKQAEADSQDTTSPFKSVDPAPAANPSATESELRDTLMNEDLDLFDRYAAMFALRNRGTAEAVDAIIETLAARSALLRHEVAYVLGQLQSERATQALVATLQNESEHPMVRHEAAEALGSIADPASVELLRKFRKHSEPIVSQSCEVALDMLQHEQAGDFEYATVEVATRTVNGSQAMPTLTEIC